MGSVNDRVSVWVWGWWVGVGGSPLTLVCAQVWHGWAGVGQRWFGLGGWWVRVGRAACVHESLGLVGWDWSLAVCTFGFGLDGLGLVGRGLCMRVWGWGVRAWFVRAGMVLAHLDAYVGPA